MVLFSLSAFVAVSLLPSLTLGAPGRAPEEFDYVIVGGGAAGSILASRLSEDLSKSVLLLEAGPNNTGLENVEIPYDYAKLFMSKYDYNYTLTPQPNLDGRVLPYFRGRLLGGSTSINGMTYTRGPSSDWDRLASYLGDPSWSWKNIRSYFLNNEAFCGPAGASSSPARFTPSVHGTQGPIGVSLNEATEWIVSPTLEAAEQVGIPYNKDGNSGNPLGISWQQFAIKNGKRSSAATGYLPSGVRARRNLEIKVESVVQRVLRSSGRGDKFDTVEYVNNAGNIVKVTAKHEIILSAGVVDSPVLLMRSGLGPAADLRAANVTPIFDIPALGQHFIEHIGLPMTWSANSTLTDDELDRNTTLYGEEYAKWKSGGKGRLSQTSLTHIVFDRIPANASIWATEEDPSGGPNAPHFEQIVSNKWTTLALPPTTGNYIGMTHFVTTPTSRGSIKLNPANPAGMPLINPQSLSTEWDKFVLRYAIRRTLAYVNAPAWKKYGIRPTFELEESATDEELDAFIRANAFGGAHGVSTARIGRANSKPGTDVVGPDFRVKGVKGLRIVDASVVPFMPNGHSMAPVYIVAEKAADIIRWG